MVRFRDVDKGMSSESPQVGDVRFVSTPGLFWDDIIEGMCGGDIVNTSSVAEGVKPVVLGKVGIE